MVEMGPSQSGELTIVRVLGGKVPTRAGGGWSELLVRMPSGRELPTTLREFLPVGEHVWAIYSISEGHGLIQLHTYLRCGSSPCPPGMKP